MGAVRAIGLAGAAAGLIALTLGFLDFAEDVRALDGHGAPPDADAIVALTGGTVARLSTAVELLEAGHGRRLLISGVNPQVRDDELKALIGASPDLFACCIDIGRAAEDTLGNASETAAWAKTHGFDSLIIVTDDYHMPRSLAELRVAMPAAALAAHPVATRVSAPEVWRSDWKSAGRMASEYLKFLIVRGREALLALDDAPPRAEPPAA